MSIDTVANPPQAESKSSRKKKAKAEATAVPAPERSTSEQGGSDQAKAGDGEHAYVKELQKQVRNINKKLNAMTKVDAIVEANPGVSLDDLVASRKMNADQKASALKKPYLIAQREQLEDQLATYKKFDQEYQQKISQEKENLQQSHTAELEKVRETAKAEAESEKQKLFRENLLTLSRFLRAAAARRQQEEDDSDLSKAFEGALLQVYGGDNTAVAAAVKLIEGSDENVPSTEGVETSVTYAQVKQTALEEAPFAAEEAWVDDVAQSQPGAPESEAETATANSTDPTIANAGLTEIQTEDTLVNEKTETEAEAHEVPAATIIDTGAANAAATEQWDKQPSSADDPLTESYEIVPRDASETETPAAAAPVGSVSSWADQSQDAAAGAAPQTNGGEGFAEVSHNRGRGRGGFQGEGRGGFRGRGGQRGDGRGRGGRGRGRGDFRGGARGGFRGGRGGSEATQQ